MQLCFASVEKFTVPDVPPTVCGATWISPTKPHLPDFAARVRARLARFGCLEDLHAIVAAIADIQQAVVRQLGAMKGAAEKLRLHLAGLEIVRPRAGAFTDIGTSGVLAHHGILAVSAEMADVLAGRCVDDQHAPVAVTVGDVHEVRLRIDDHIGRPVTAPACR